MSENALGNLTRFLERNQQAIPSGDWPTENAAPGLDAQSDAARSREIHRRMISIPWNVDALVAGVIAPVALASAQGRNLRDVLGEGFEEGSVHSDSGFVAIYPSEPQGDEALPCIVNQRSDFDSVGTVGGNQHAGHEQSSPSAKVGGTIATASCAATGDVSDGE